MNNSQGHRRSITFISRDRKYIQIVYKEQYKVYKQTCLCNKFVFTNDVINIFLQDRVEVEVQNKRYKVFEFIPLLSTRNIDLSDIEIHSNPQLTTY